MTHAPVRQRYHRATQRCPQRRGILRSRRLGMEPLEERRVLATVTLNTDTGVAGELRTTIAAALPGDTIDFKLSAGNETITLVSNELVINKNLVVNGANLMGSGVPITISGGNASRVLRIDDGNGTINTMTAKLSNLTITKGSATDGGGILSRENLTLNSVRVTDNKAFQPNVALATFGGGILNFGNLSLIDSTVSSNKAAFAPAGGNSAFGGGIASTGIGSSLTLLGSDVSSNETIGGSGGGIFSQMGRLSISSSTISGNRAGLDTSVHGPIQRYDSGAGIAVLSEGPGSTFAAFDVDIQDSHITDNVLSNDALTDDVFPYGGGFYARGKGTVDITNSCISGNSVLGTAAPGYTVIGRGGGLFFYGDDNGDLAVNITKSEISDNRSIRHGGAIATQARHTTDGDPLDDGTVHLNIVGSTISGNSAVRSAGGIFNRALYSDQADTSFVRIQSSRISGNSVDTDNLGGGGLVNRSGGTVEIDNSTFENNSAYYGGAVYQYATGLLPTPPDPPAGIPRVTIRNTTLTGNHADGNGGGVYSYDGTLEIFQSTISGNSAKLAGGGLYLNTFNPWVGTPAETFSKIERSTVTANDAPYGGGIGTDYYHGTNWSNSVISGNTGMAGFEDLYLQGNPNVVQSFNYVGGAAKLGPLMDNGGPTLTHLPLAGSPLINSGDPLAAGMTDQRGYRDRITGGKLDIGAVEVGARAVCDRDSDGDCDLDDIDMVMALIASGSATLAARDEWLASAGAENLACGLPYGLADFNLDGVTDGSDFGIWNTFKFTPSTRWSRGNVNGDLVVDGSDFGVWNTFKFTSACSTANCNPARNPETPGDLPNKNQSLRHEPRNKKNRQEADAPKGGRIQKLMASAAAQESKARGVAVGLPAVKVDDLVENLSKALQRDLGGQSTSNNEQSVQAVTAVSPTARPVRQAHGFVVPHRSTGIVPKADNLRDALGRFDS